MVVCYCMLLHSLLIQALTRGDSAKPPRADKIRLASTIHFHQKQKNEEGNKRIFFTVKLVLLQVPGDTNTLIGKGLLNSQCNEAAMVQNAAHRLNLFALDSHLLRAHVSVCNPITWTMVLNKERNAKDQGKRLISSLAQMLQFPRMYDPG